MTVPWREMQKMAPGTLPPYGDAAPAIDDSGPSTKTPLSIRKVAAFGSSNRWLGQAMNSPRSKPTRGRAKQPRFERILGEPQEPQASVVVAVDGKAVRSIRRLDERLRPLGIEDKNLAALELEEVAG